MKRACATNRMTTGTAVAVVAAVLTVLGAITPASAQSLTWAILPSPDVGAAWNSLTAVSCPATAFCVAVGGESPFDNGPARQLIASWHGSTWSFVPVPEL